MSQIIAFLNSVLGGSLYLGINDDGVVTGCFLNRADRDRFRQRINGILRSINPAVLPTKCTVNFVPVANHPQQHEAAPPAKSQGQEVTPHIGDASSKSLPPLPREAVVRKAPFVIEVAVQPGLTATQPIPYESPLHIAYLKQPGGWRILHASNEFLWWSHVPSSMNNYLCPYLKVHKHLGSLSAFRCYYHKEKFFFDLGYVAGVAVMTGTERFELYEMAKSLKTYCHGTVNWIVCERESFLISDCVTTFTYLGCRPCYRGHRAVDAHRTISLLA